jgi:F-type H+-transporting ATPase subunit delta
MKITKELRRASRKIFRECFVNGLLDEQRVRDVITAVATSRPRGYLGILTELERLVRIDFQKRNVLIESATQLQSSDIQNLEAEIRKRSKTPLNITHKVSPSLLGGVRIRIGSDIWDGSVSARLKQLEVKN